MKKLLPFLFFSFLLFSSVNALSGEISNKYKDDINKIENYFNNIKYLSSIFLQESSDGSVTYGKFYLSRPGKMRIEYQEPSEIVIVVNGGVLTYQDVELEETSYLRTNSTPASFLTRKNISFFAKDIEITNISKKNDIIRVSLIKKNKKEAGEFTLVFQENPIKFLKMEVKNDMDQITAITLENHDFKSKISKKLFIIKNNQLP